MQDDAQHAFDEDAFAARYTEFDNRRTTLQCARELHANLQLDSAGVVLEVAAGGGLGSLDIAERMHKSASSTKRCKKLVVTDIMPVMVRLAKRNLLHSATSSLEIDVHEANGEDLKGVADASVDRYVSAFCLHGAENPDKMLQEARRVLKADGIAGFTIWSEEARSGAHVIGKAVANELSVEFYSYDLFSMGKDLDGLQARFQAAGFSQVRVWPYMCVIECWSGEDFAAFQEQLNPSANEEIREKKFQVTKRRADEWLQTGQPIGYEAYIILARP